MELNYDHEQTMLGDAVGRFLSTGYAPQRKDILASKPGWSRVIWRELADLGCMALPFRAEHGGLEGDAPTLGLVAEMLGRHLVVEPFLPAVLVAGRLVESLGNAPQRENLLDPLMQGERLLAFAHEESPRHQDSEPLRTVARRSGEGWIVSGRKTIVLGGPCADWLLVSAQLDASAHIGVFTVAAGHPGVIVHAYQSTAQQPAADIDLVEVQLSADALLGSDAVDASEAISEIRDRATALMCADAVGAMQAMTESTAEYLKTRVQFGKPLATFQALQHRMASMAVHIMEARAITLLALLESDAPARERALAVSAAKAKVGRCAQFVGQGAVQLHGGIGATEDLQIGDYFRRLVAFQASMGSTNEHIERFGALLGDTPVSERSLLRERA